METTPATAERVRVILDDGVYEGGLLDGERSGFGTYKWNNGDYFEGHYLCGRKEGKGRYVWGSTGDSYTGEYFNNRKHGQGILLSKSTGTTYEGNFAHGKRNGAGTLRYSDGTVYVGAFHSGKRSGRGRLQRPNGDTYEGDFKSDATDGRGVYTFRDGRVYDGHFSNGLKHGEGTFKAAFAKAFYIGSFANDTFNGYGQYTRQSGETYAGQWVDGKAHGKGTCKYADGAQYSGEWACGRWSGQGRIEYPKHSIYMGAFEAGLKSGSGAYAGHDGTTFEGTWAQGVLVSGKALGHIGSVGIDDYASSERIDVKYASLNPLLDFVCKADSIIASAIEAGGAGEEKRSGGASNNNGNADIIINAIIELELENFHMIKQLGSVNYEYLHGRIQSLEEESQRLKAALQDRAESAQGAAAAGHSERLVQSMFPGSPPATGVDDASERSGTDYPERTLASSSALLSGLPFYSSKKAAAQPSSSSSSLFGTYKTIASRAEEGGSSSLSNSTRRFFAFGKKTAETTKDIAAEESALPPQSGNNDEDEAAAAAARIIEDLANGNSAPAAAPVDDTSSTSRPASPTSSSRSTFSADRDKTTDTKRRLKLACESDARPAAAIFPCMSCPEGPLSGIIQNVTNPSSLVTDRPGYEEGGAGRFEFFLIEPDFKASRGQHGMQSEYSLPSKVSWAYTDGKSSNIDCMNEFCFPNGVPFDMLSSSCTPYATGELYDKLHIMQFSSDSSSSTTYACCLTVVSAQLPPQDQPELCEELLDRAVRIRAARRIKSNIYKLFKKVRRRRWDEMTGLAAESMAANSSFDSDHGADRNKASFISRYFRRSSSQALSLAEVVTASPSPSKETREASASVDSSSSPKAAARLTTLEEAALQLTANTSSFASRRNRGRPSLRNKVLITQQTYCIMSTRPDHAYYFRALRAMAAAERAILSEDILNNSSSSAALISDRRNTFLSALHYTVLEQMRLSPSPIPSPSPHSTEELVGETVSGDFESGFTIHVDRYVTGLRLRMQDLPATPDWAAAVLFSCCSSRIIFKVINLMLTERSIIVCGQNAGLVTAIATAMHALIQPFRWAGVFVPLVPLSARELFEAPVPFILGTTSLPDIERISTSAAVISLDDPQATHSNEYAHRRGHERPETEAWFTRLPEVSSDMPISEPLEAALNGARRMLLAYKKKAVGEGCDTSGGGSGDRVSMIHSYHLYDLCFVESMAQKDITLVRSMLRQICDGNYKYCGDVDDAGAWKNYVRYNPQTGEDEFYSSWFMQSARRQVEFQETLASTQLFVAYIDSLRRQYSANDRQRLFLSDWIGYRMYLRRRARGEASGGNSLITTENINSLLEWVESRA